LYCERCWASKTQPNLLADFLDSNWQWLWAALVVPVAGYIWKRWKAKEKKAKTKPANEHANDG
jgi:hypothetical protein